MGAVFRNRPPPPHFKTCDHNQYPPRTWDRTRKRERPTWKCFSCLAESRSRWSLRYSQEQTTVAWDGFSMVLNSPRTSRARDGQGSWAFPVQRAGVDGGNREDPKLGNAALRPPFTQAASQEDERGLARPLYILLQDHNLGVDPMRTNPLTSLVISVQQHGLPPPLSSH